MSGLLYDPSTIKCFNPGSVSTPFIVGASSAQRRWSATEKFYQSCQRQVPNMSMPPNLLRSRASPIFSSGRSAPLMIYTHSHAHIATPDAVSGLAPQPMHGIYHVLSRLCPESISEDLIVPCTRLCSTRIFKMLHWGTNTFCFA